MDQFIHRELERNRVKILDINDLPLEPKTSTVCKFSEVQFS